VRVAQPMHEVFAGRCHDCSYTCLWKYSRTAGRLSPASEHAERAGVRKVPGTVGLASRQSSQSTDRTKVSATATRRRAWKCRASVREVARFVLK
jgi:hypothetical protein